MSPGLYFLQTFINLLICQTKMCAADGCCATERVVTQANQQLWLLIKSYNEGMTDFLHEESLLIGQ